MFPSPEAFAVEVEFYCAAHRICGRIRLPNDSSRLTDLLNAADESLHLTDVSVFSLGRAAHDEIGELTLEKQTVRLALPRESQDFLSRRRLTRAGIARPNYTPVPALILLPPYTVKGLLYSGVGADRGWLEPSRFPRFVSVTDASVYRDGRLLVGETFIAVSRDAIAAIGRAAVEAPAPTKPRAQILVR